MSFRDKAAEEGRGEPNSSTDPSWAQRVSYRSGDWPFGGYPSDTPGFELLNLFVNPAEYSFLRYENLPEGVTVELIRWPREL